MVWLDEYGKGKRLCNRSVRVGICTNRNITLKRKENFMGTLEMALLLNVGLPLALKLINGGKNSDEAAKIAQMAVSDISVIDQIATATPQQNKEIVDGLYDVLSGAGGAFGNLIGLLGNLGKK